MPSRILAGIAILFSTLSAWGLPADTVWVRLSVDPSGSVASAELVQNTGTQKMADIAIQRLRAIRYRPNIVNGKAVASTTTVEINFRKVPKPAGNSTAPAAAASHAPTAR